VGVLCYTCTNLGTNHPIFYVCPSLLSLNCNASDHNVSGRYLRTDNGEILTSSIELQGLVFEEADGRVITIRISAVMLHSFLVAIVVAAVLFKSNLHDLLVINNYMFYHLLCTYLNIMMIGIQLCLLRSV